MSQNDSKMWKTMESQNYGMFVKMGSMANFKVLIVEDDHQISKSLSINLRHDGHEVVVATTIGEGWRQHSQKRFDIILLDVNLPDGSGIELCQRIRSSNSEVPIIFLSARTDEETVVRGISIGGNDYIRKPFGIDELKARIKKIVRGTQKLTNLIKFGEMEIDVDGRSVSISNTVVPLGRREFDILLILSRKKGDVVTRENIMQGLGQEADLYDRTIDSHISHLRSKLKDAGGKVTIASVYGVGYRLEWQK